MSSTTLYLRYKDEELQFAQGTDSDDKFSKMEESSQINIDSGDSVTWKTSSEPGDLEKIKINKVNKKDNVTLPSGSWKDQWTKKPTKVSDQEYIGTPNGSGATKDSPFYFAYDVDYKIKNQNGWTTLDPDIKIPKEDS